MIDGVPEQREFRKNVDASYCELEHEDVAGAVLAEVQRARVASRAATFPHFSRVHQQGKRLGEGRLQHKVVPVVREHEVHVDGYVQRPV